MGEDTLQQLIQQFMGTSAGSKLANSINTLPDLDDINFKSSKKLTTEEKELRDQKIKEAKEKRKEERKNKLKSQIPSFSYQVSPVNINPELAQSKYSITAENIEIDFDDSSLLYNINGETFNAGNYLSILSKTKYIYEITGKIYNSITTEPLSGVEVKLSVRDPKSTGNTNITGSDQGIDINNSEISIDPFDYIYLPTPGLMFTKTTPKIFSITKASTQETQNPPYSTYIVPQFLDSLTILTDSKGEFKILVNLPTIPANQKVPLFWALTFTKKGFIPNSVSILNGDSTIKSDLQSVGMVDIASAAISASAKYISELDEVQRKVDSIILEPIDKIIAYRRKGIGSLVNTIKTKLIPLCLELLITFGITKISQSNQKTCPTPESLNEVIRKRNQVTRQLNQIYQSIVINSTLAVAFFALSNVLKGVKLQLDGLLIPQAIGLPPGPPGGLIFAQPYSLTGKLQKISDLIEKLSEQNKSLNKNNLISLIFLIAGITTAILLLNAVDKLSQECAEEGGVTLPEQEAINVELLALTEESKAEGNPIVSFINGFELSVVPDDKNLVGTLKRRFAIAKNQQGVIQLKGEPSFSSNDQILIDELVFYIQQNDLKAF